MVFLGRFKNVQIFFKRFLDRFFKPTFQDLLSILCMFLLFLIYYRTLDLELYTYSNNVEILSTNISSLVSFLAINFTLSLLIVQYAAEKYSIKLIDYYIKDKLFWLLFLQFLSSIILNIIVLSYYIKNNNLIDICIMCTLYCFSLMIPQIINIANMIQPDTLASYLLEKCQQSIIEKGLMGDIRYEDSPTRELYEFSKTIIKNDDYGTLNRILNEIDLIIRVKENDDIELNLIDNVNSFFYNSYYYSTVFDKYEACRLIASSYFRIYNLICERNFTYDKMKKFSRLFSEILDLSMKEKIYEVCKAYVNWIQNIAEIKLKNYLPNQEDIFLYRKDFTDKGDNDTENFLKLSDFESDLYSLNKLGNFFYSNELYSNIGTVIINTYLILQKVLINNKGDKLTYNLTSLAFYNLSELCYKCINENNTEFTYGFGIITPREDIEKKSNFWLYTIANFICNVSLYQTEKGQCSFDSYHHIGVLGRTLAPDHIDVLKYLIDILSKMANIEIQNSKKEGLTSFYYSRHKNNIEEIKKEIESIRDWENQKDKNLIQHANENLHKIDAQILDTHIEYVV